MFLWLPQTQSLISIFPELGAFLNWRGARVGMTVPAHTGGAAYFLSDCMHSQVSISSTRHRQAQSRSLKYLLVEGKANTEQGYLLWRDSLACREIISSSFFVLQKTSFKKLPPQFTVSINKSFFLENQMHKSGWITRRSGTSTEMRVVWSAPGRLIIQLTSMHLVFQELC